VGGGASSPLEISIIVSFAFEGWADFFAIGLIIGFDLTAKTVALGRGRIGEGEPGRASSSDSESHSRQPDMIARCFGEECVFDLRGDFLIRLSSDNAPSESEDACVNFLRPCF
jgi:hypothetical protein